MSEDDNLDGVAQEKINSVKARVDKLSRHIANVQEACFILGKKLIDRGEIDFGIHLIRVGQIHDASKWRGIEWDYLIDPPKNGNGVFAAAVNQHQEANPHHPEYWGTINDMPRLYVAEMCCDFYARATEFGTSVWEWVKEQAMPRYGISPQGKVYKWIKEFLDLLLEKPFSEVPDDE